MRKILTIGLAGVALASASSAHAQPRSGSASVRVRQAQTVPMFTATLGIAFGP